MTFPDDKDLTSIIDNMNLIRKQSSIRGFKWGAGLALLIEFLICHLWG